MPDLNTSEDLRAQVAQILDCPEEELAFDTNLVASGLGSLEMMRLVNKWRRQGVDVELSVLAADPTIRAWTNLMCLDSQHPRPTCERAKR
jgi:phenyloxazoline synthase mbtB